MVDTYRVRVRGHLGDRWSDWLGGLAVRRQADGTTVLVGPVVDQAALHGVIAKIRDLGLPLLSVNRVGQSHRRTSRAVRRGARGRTQDGTKRRPTRRTSAAHQRRNTAHVGGSP